MLSILIPSFNYNVLPLVTEIHRQVTEANIEFEIICFDDHSTTLFLENEKINNLHNTKYEILEKNIGRTSIRNLLAKKAKFSYFLFLDADVVPVEDNFIEKYLVHIKANNKIVFGGCFYRNTPPQNSQIFRYIYGKKREEKPAEGRNKNPHQYVFSGNVLIQKQLFLETNYKPEGNYYGMDVYFSYLLYSKKIPIVHIDNPIYHLGLENNIVFFEKSLEAVKTKKRLLLNLEKVENISPLLKHYKILKKYHLQSIVIIGFKIIKPILKRLVLNNNPNLFCFDIYRLGYICEI